MLTAQEPPKTCLKNFSLPAFVTFGGGQGITGHVCHLLPLSSWSFSTDVGPTIFNFYPETSRQHLGTLNQDLPALRSHT